MQVYISASYDIEMMGGQKHLYLVKQCPLGYPCSFQPIFGPTTWLIAYNILRQRSPLQNAALSSAIIPNLLFLSLTSSTLFVLTRACAHFEYSIIHSFFRSPNKIIWIFMFKMANYSDDTLACSCRVTHYLSFPLFRIKNLVRTYDISEPLDNSYILS